MDTFLILLIFIFSMLIGGYLSDNATLKDCATKNKVVLASGAVIECLVIKEGRHE